jgi:hypothetical protein
VTRVLCNWLVMWAILTAGFGVVMFACWMVSLAWGVHPWLAIIAVLGWVSIIGAYHHA